MLTLLLVSLMTALGGWATITVDELPDYLVAQRASTLTFVVRQHGVRPLSGLEPRLEAVTWEGGTRRSVTVAAVPGDGPGRYSATFTLPVPERWVITIYSGFNSSRVDLGIGAIAPDAAAPAPLAAAERGRALFVAKGCATCHVYKGLSPDAIAVGPELTDLRLPAELLTRFLADPAAVIPPPAGGYGMPNLGLKPAEIAALVAFLGAGSSATGE